jgi:hypothetical protein
MPLCTRLNVKEPRESYQSAGIGAIDAEESNRGLSCGLRGRSGGVGAGPGAGSNGGTGSAGAQSGGEGPGGVHGGRRRDGWAVRAAGVDDRMLVLRDSATDLARDVRLIFGATRLTTEHLHRNELCSI